MKDHLTLKVKEKEFLSEITIGMDLLEEEAFLKQCQHLSKRFAIISDHKVAKLYGTPLLEFLEQHGFDATLHHFPAGEKNKNRGSKHHLEDLIFKAGHNRDSCLIALGGGVTTDLVGFIAATFCRGIPYLSIPTSLMAMVDASIGGKTAINVPFGKNLVGAIHLPKSIFIDISMLGTLPDQELLEGSAEILKTGLIANRHLFDLIDEEQDKWRGRDLPFFKKLIYESCKVKLKVVEADHQENGMRRMLNFGHTIAHAIEVLEKHQVSHGEAVAIGIVAESFLSMRLKGLKESEFDEIYARLKSFGFSLKISERVTIEGMMEAMKHDKKGKGGTPRFVVLDGIGHVKTFKGDYCSRVDETLLHEVLGWMISEFQRDES